MDSIRDIFKAGSEGAKPIMSDSTRSALPAGIENYMQNTDVVVGQADVSPRVSVTIDPQNPIRLDTLKEMDEARRSALAGNRPSMYEIRDPAFIEKDVCIVAAGTQEMDYESVLTRAGRLVALQQGNPYNPEHRGLYPGTQADWAAFILMHEDGHCADMKDGDGMTGLRTSQEASADRTFVHTYMRAYQDGVVSNLEVPYAVRGFRAVDTMLSGDKGYAANGVLALPGESSVLNKYDSPEAVGSAVLAARNEVFREIGGMTSPTRSDYRAAFVELFQENVLTMGALDSEGRIKEAYQDVHHDRMLEKSGKRLGMEQPPLIYETSRRMLHEGAFAGNPAGEKFIGNFVDAIQRYEPALFDVDPANRPTQRPAIVDQMVANLSVKPTIEPGLGALP